jgi:hypothetical protein
LVQRILIAHPEDTAAEMIRLLDLAVQRPGPELIRGRPVRPGEDGAGVSGVELHKFIVGLDQDDAVNTIAVWSQHPRVRDALSASNVFDSVESARSRLTELVEQGNQEGTCEPGHECGRCKDWPPQVWEVTLSAKLVVDTEG